MIEAMVLEISSQALDQLGVAVELYREWHRIIILPISTWMG